MYKTDESGEYRVSDKWIRAWSGGGAYVAGFNVCELREYASGASRVYSGEPIYIHERPDLHFAHSVYMQAQKELGI